MELHQRGGADRRLPAAAHGRAVGCQVRGLRWRAPGGSRLDACHLIMHTPQGARTCSWHIFMRRRTLLSEALPVCTAMGRLQCELQASCINILSWVFQAMIEGLGILLTKMTAPPPAPPPALDGMMGAPQPGAHGLSSSWLWRRSSQMDDWVLDNRACVSHFVVKTMSA